ncbi:iron hydrogenase 1 [Clostridium tepidiprofundi DSM 19306]|uniref:Iron hydrogenase 1 n=1 Tax=Clostridium tepidiprofundi DSM 19306 TaxID=1121338 RepID=A0A151B3U0_9CLOT|nr:4Fe-4S dicluster domain-containing protein [Clostridium tepidiprofundi]KYH34317.1 iron hydrogenase 1 [Clostridium tepidiprofundi DSM 19306]
MDKVTNVQLIKFESNVQLIKYQVLKEVAKLAFEGALKENYHEIPKKIIPGPKPITRCCIYHEREVVKERVRMAMGGNRENKNNIEVLEAACDKCPVQRYVVTEACRGCLAHKCEEACPFGAISVVDHKARINWDICKECGKCKDACPYNAIVDVLRPCMKACNVGALSMDEEGKARIDDSKCIQCGSCVYSCPFGAIEDKSYIVDTIELIKKAKSDKFNAYAIIAPAISSQFTFATIGQVVTAIKKLGFHDVVEAALGADIVTENETKEFAENVNSKGFITSSCCPAFVAYINKNYPELMDNVSTSVSPMIATARLIKSLESNARIVFIGPCIAKKMEAQQDDIKDEVDYVLTFEELLALLDAADIQVNDCEESVLDNASLFGRIFARSGGLTEAIKEVIEEKNIDIEYNPVTCNGIKECDIALKMAKVKRLKGNFIEGMACVGGCIGGPGVLQHHGPKNKKAVDEYGKMAKEHKIEDVTKIFDTSSIRLHRNFDKAFKK